MSIDTLFMFDESVELVLVLCLSMCAAVMSSTNSTYKRCGSNDVDLWFAIFLRASVEGDEERIVSDWIKMPQCLIARDRINNKTVVKIIWGADICVGELKSRVYVHQRTLTVSKKSCVPMLSV